MGSMVLLSSLSLHPGKCGLSARFSLDGFAVLDLVVRSSRLFMGLLHLGETRGKEWPSAPVGITFLCCLTACEVVSIFSVVNSELAESNLLAGSWYCHFHGPSQPQKHRPYKYVSFQICSDT